MATIALIIIGVISLLVKWNKLTREVFCWLVAGREHSMFFSRQKVQNERWEVVLGQQILFFLKNPRTPGGPTSSGLVVVAVGWVTAVICFWHYFNFF
jgi:hypothetical protein